MVIFSCVHTVLSSLVLNYPDLQLHIPLSLCAFDPTDISPEERIFIVADVNETMEYNDENDASPLVLEGVECLCSMLYSIVL